MSETRSDADLMGALGQGDQGAWEVLVQRHQDGLVNFFYRMSGDRYLAEDLAQDVFVRLYLHGSEYEPRAEFATYLYRVARNLWIDYWRKTRHERQQTSLDAPDAEGRTIAERIAASVDAPPEERMRDEFSEEVVAAIDSLAEEHKLVFVLSEVKGMRYRDIAEALEIPLGTVKSRMHHAVQQLRETLAPPRGKTKPAVHAGSAKDKEP